MNSRSPLRLLLLGSACLVAMVVAFYLIANWRGRTAWEAYEKEARSRGTKLTLAEYLPPEIPDAENFASISLFQEAFAAASAGGSTLSQLNYKIRPKKNGSSDHGRQLLVDLAEWRRALIAEKALPDAAPAVPADAVLQYLDRFESEMAPLRAAVHRPGCRFPADWEKAFNDPKPHLTPLLSAAQVNKLRLEAHLAKGESAAAYADFQLALRLGRALEHEPTLINGLVNAALLQIAVSGVWSGLATEKWDDEALRRIAEDLALVRPLPQYVFAVDSERAALNQHYEKLRSGKDPNLEMALVNLGIHEKVAAAGVDLFPPGWLYDNQLASNQFTDEMLTEVDGVRELYRPKPELWKPERFEGGNFLHRTHYALFLFGSLGLSGTSRYYLAGHMQVQQARVACALERFRHLHGAYPATLDVLVPVFLPAIPHDALDGRPLRYRVEPGGRFTLYSVGMDGMDNGGVFDPKKAFNQQADWVWGYPLPATAAPVLPTP